MGTLRSPPERKTGWYYSFLLANVTNGATAPLIPLFLVVAFAGTLMQVGVITAATSVASIPAFIIWGNLSDHLHMRKLFIVEGFAGLAISVALMWLSVDFVMFFVANFLLGLLYAASPPAGTALLIEQSPREQWASRMGMFSRVGGAGYLLGLVSGAAWFTFLPSNQSTMRLFFFFGASVATIGAAVAAMLIDEGQGAHALSNGGHESRRNAVASLPMNVMERAKYIPSRIGAVIRLAAPTQQERTEIGRHLWLYYLVTILFSTGFTAFYSVFPNYLFDYLGRRFMIDQPDVFIVYIGSSLASTLAFGKVSSLIRGRSEKAIQLVAVSARIALIPSFFALPLFLTSSLDVVIVMIVLNSLMGVCWAIISVTGQAIVAGMAGQHIKGEAMGLYNSATGTGAIMGALLGGLAAINAGFMYDFLLSSVFVGAGATVLSILNTGSGPTEAVEKSASGRTGARKPKLSAK